MKPPTRHQTAADSTFPVSVLQLLFTDTTAPYVTPNTNVDFVLYLSDDSAPGGNTIDDLVNLSSTAKPPVALQEHLFAKNTDTAATYPTPGVAANFKLFKNMTTRIYTDLYWPDVYFNAFSVAVTDPQDHGTQATSSGFWDFDSGQTRVGVTIDSNHRVYMIVRLGLNATSLSLDTMTLSQGQPFTNPFQGIEGGGGFFS